MKNAITEALIFVVGAAIGSAVTYVAVKSKYEEKADMEIAAIQRAFDDRMARMELHKNSLSGELKGPEEIDVKKEVERLTNKPDILDYTKYFKSSGEKLPGNELTRDAAADAKEDGLSEEELAQRELSQNGIDPAEMESPPEDEPYTDEEDREQTLSYEDEVLNGAHKRALEDNKEPYEIDASDFGLTCRNYEKMDLLWYVYDEELTNTAGEIVDRDLFVGDLIDKSGFDVSRDEVMYVRNDKLMCDFIITKIYEKMEEGKD